MPTPTKTLRLLGAAFLLALAPACSRYDQQTPEAVLAAAKDMVRSGHAERLPDLVYAESQDMRDLLTKLGDVMGTLQDLGKEVQKRFPEEIDTLRQQAEEAAKKGEASSFLQTMTGQALGARGGGRTGGRDRRAPPSPEEAEKMRSGFDTLMKEVFADPYGWLERSEGRLTVSRANMPDDVAAILWDGKPALGVGLTLKQEKGDWYLVLPTSIPGTGRIMPKSKDSWEVLGELMEVFDNTLKDLRDDVRRGRILRLEDLAHNAGEKAFVPVALVFLAYGKVKDAERKERAAEATPAPAAAPPVPK